MEWGADIPREIDWPTVGPRLLEALEAIMHWHPLPDTIRRMGLDPRPAEAAWHTAHAAIIAAKGEQA